MFPKLGNDHGFIIKEYSLQWYEVFWGQYHTIVESRIHLTWYQSHALNLVMSIESSNVKQMAPKEKRSRGPSKA